MLNNLTPKKALIYSIIVAFALFGGNIAFDQIRALDDQEKDKSAANALYRAIISDADERDDLDVKIGLNETGHLILEYTLKTGDTIGFNEPDPISVTDSITANVTKAP